MCHFRLAQQTAPVARARPGRPPANRSHRPRIRRDEVVGNDPAGSVSPFQRIRKAPSHLAPHSMPSPWLIANILERLFQAEGWSRLPVRTIPYLERLARKGADQRLCATQGRARVYSASNRGGVSQGREPRLRPSRDLLDAPAHDRVDGQAGSEWQRPVVRAGRRGHPVGPARPPGPEERSPRHR